MTYMLWFSYNWFKFCFCLFQTHYHTCMLPYPKTKGNREFKSRIKLNQNIYNLVCLRQKMWIFPGSAENKFEELSQSRIGVSGGNQWIKALYL